MYYFTFHILDLTCAVFPVYVVKPTNLQFTSPIGPFSKPYNTNLQFTSPTALVLECMYFGSKLKLFQVFQVDLEHPENENFKMR
jgi:hypothetical protein